MSIYERVYHGFLAQGMADAVGNPFEFKDKPKPFDVLQYAKDNRDIRTITDDTQMALFGLEAVKDIIMNDANPLDSFKKQYINWYRTQFNESPIAGADSMLMKEPMMYVQRAPGMTCLSALGYLDANMTYPNNSMGCGSVMRLLPLTLLFDYFPYTQVMEIVKVSVDLTHHHPLNMVAAEKLMDAFYAIYQNEPTFPVMAEMISDLGEGWVAPECVDMAIWAFQNAKTYDELLTLSICHKGDSDSVAAIAGALWGFAYKDYYASFLEKDFMVQYLQETIGPIVMEDF